MSTDMAIDLNIERTPAAGCATRQLAASSLAVSIEQELQKFALLWQSSGTAAVWVRVLRVHGAHQLVRSVLDCPGIGNARDSHLEPDRGRVDLHVWR